MQFIYVIQSNKTDNLYFGRPSNLEERLKEHNSGSVHSTQKDRPWEYVYCEGYREKRDAIKREQQLKQYGNARTYVKKRLEHSINKVLGAQKL